MIDGDKITSVTVSGSRIDAGSTENIPSAAVIKKGDKDVTANYDIKYVKGTLTVAKNTVNNVTVDIEGWTYGETAKEPKAVADFGTDKAVFTYSNAENGTYVSTVPANAGTWYVKAEVAGTENYAGGLAVKSFTIVQADKVPGAPSSKITVEFISAGAENDKVSKVALPENWVWADTDKDKALVAGSGVTATAVYTGADKANYTDAARSIQVTITRSTCTHTDADTEVRNAKAATCTENGYTGDTYCKICGNMIKSGSVRVEFLSLIHI